MTFPDAKILPFDSSIAVYVAQLQLEGQQIVGLSPGGHLRFRIDASGLCTAADYAHRIADTFLVPPSFVEFFHGDAKMQVADTIEEPDSITVKITKSPMRQIWQTKEWMDDVGPFCGAFFEDG